MTAPIVTNFRNPIQASALESFAERTRTFLERPIHHGNRGQLWERASYEATLTPSANGWLMAFYVIGRHPHAERFGPRHGFSTREKAQAWLDADTPAAKLARWEYARVQAGLYFTRSGRIVKWPTDANTAEEA